MYDEDEVVLIVNGNHNVDLSGQRLAGRYQLRSCIGRGGMGAVYEALDTTLNRRVAVKVLLRDNHADAVHHGGGSVGEEASERFRREALAAASLSHPHIAQVTDFVAATNGNSNSREPAFLVMEMLEGEDLSKLLRRADVLPVERAVSIAIQVASALATAHAAGIVHRDIKPQNIFLVRSSAATDFVKVLDFGIAKMMLDTAGLTATGDLLGTMKYMSPEQVMTPRAVGPPSDVWSLGIVLYMMLSGAPPFEGNGFAHANVEIVPLARRCPALPSELVAIVSRALSIDPRDRFRDGAELCAALQKVSHPRGDGLTQTSSFAENSDRTERQEQEPSRSRVVVKPALLFAAAAGGVLLVGSIALMALFSHRKTPHGPDPVIAASVSVSASPSAAPSPDPTASAASRDEDGAAPTAVAAFGSTTKSPPPAKHPPSQLGVLPTLGASRLSEYRTEIDRPGDTARLRSVEPTASNCLLKVDLSKCHSQRLEVLVRVSVDPTGKTVDTSATISNNGCFDQNKSAVTIDSTPFARCVKPAFLALAFGASQDPNFTKTANGSLAIVWPIVWQVVVNNRN